MPNNQNWKVKLETWQEFESGEIVFYELNNSVSHFLEVNVNLRYSIYSHGHVSFQMICELGWNQLMYYVKFLNKLISYNNITSYIIQILDYSLSCIFLNYKAWLSFVSSKSCNYFLGWIYNCMYYKDNLEIIMQ